MKIKNISVGDSVQVKKRLVSNIFRAKQVCEVIKINSEQKFRPDVLIKGEYCLEWVNHKDLKKPIKCEPEPQLKQLDQSIFDGLDEKWRFAAVDLDGESWVYREQPKIDKGDDRWSASNTPPNSIGTGYDTSNWQNSLIERDIAKELLEVDLSSELTGSDYFHSNITSALLESGSKLVVCFVSDTSELKALSNKRIEVITSLDTSFNDSDGYGWQYAIPINNQGEPLTASEVGL